MSQQWDGEAPEPGYEMKLFRIGRKGLNVVAPLDALEPDEASRLVNLVSRNGSALEVRPGQTAYASTGASNIHSIYRLNDAGAGSYTRLVGGDASLYRGVNGALGGAVDTGYSGDPLTFAGLTVPLTGSPYVVIADRSRQKKISRTGSIEPFGTAPGLLTSTALGTQKEKSYCDFEAADPNGNSAAASWTMTAGFDRAGNATGAPTAADILGAGNFIVQYTTDPTGAAADTGYYSVVSIARTVDLTTFTGGGATTDDDLMLIQFNVNDPSILDELTVYLVCSTFTAGLIPGKDAGNSQAWYKSFRANDLTPFYTQSQSNIEASTTLQTNQLLQAFKEAASQTNPRSNQDIASGITELNRLVQPTVPAGQNVWATYGVLGIPLRRGEWARVGTEEVTSPSWSTITGIVIVIATNTNTAIAITSGDKWAIQGGSGPDACDPTAQAYDYRVRNYMPATGSKGNPSAIQSESDWLNPLRQPVTVTPTASGITAMRQQAFRRGGGPSTTDNWRYVGINTSDGGTISDTLSDDDILAEEELEIDNDQPVTTVNASGATVLNQTLPVYFVVGDYMFGLGDPYQPGRLYRSKKGEMESWPATEYQDVCPTTDTLLNGGMYAAAGFVFSSQRLYSIIINDLDGSWTTEPTACAEGPVGRWAMTVTPYGIAFVSPFGVRLTAGGAPEDLTDPLLGKLFRGETVNGYNPIDLATSTALKLAFYANELWFTYRDSSGARRQFVYNFLDKGWRSYLFGTPISTVYGDPAQSDGTVLLLGTLSTGAVNTHGGFSDLGSGIAYTYRSGAWDFGDPYVEKLLSSVRVHAELYTSDLTVQAFLNDEQIADTSQAVTGTAGLKPYTFEPFGTDPQRGRNVSVELRGTAPTDARPYFNLLGVSVKRQPAIVFNEPTPWEELPGGEGYLYGCVITCDTAGVARSIEVEYTSNNGSVTSAATLSITGTGRRKIPFSWTAVLAQQVRLRPTGLCAQWICFKVEWLTDPEPVRIPGWNTNWESFGTYADKLLKGVKIEADTFNVAKTVVVDVDQSLAAVAVGNLTFNGRGIQHIAFAEVRGRLFRLRSTDSNYGKLYRWEPIFDEDPLGLTRWETQERPYVGMAGRWQKPIEAWVTLRSTGTVTFTLTAYGSAGTVLATGVYTIASTGGAKQKVRVPFDPIKGLLFKQVLTAAAAFNVYREESDLFVEDWATGQGQWVPLFPSDDDLDPSRQMGNAVSAARTPGGGL